MVNLRLYLVYVHWDASQAMIEVVWNLLTPNPVRVTTPPTPFLECLSFQKGHGCSAWWLSLLCSSSWDLRERKSLSLQCPILLLIVWRCLFRSFLTSWLHMALVVIKFSLKIRLILKSNFVLKAIILIVFVASITFCIWGHMILACIRVYSTFHAHVA